MGHRFEYISNDSRRKRTKSAPKAALNFFSPFSLKSLPKDGTDTNDARREIAGDILPQKGNLVLPAGVF